MKKKIGIYFFCNFLVAGNENNNNNNNEKKCSRNLDGLLPKSYCERRICIVIWPREAEIVLQECIAREGGCENCIAIQLLYCRLERA